MDCPDFMVDDKLYDENHESRKWYLLQCKSGQENRALAHLSNQGFYCYKPELLVEKIKNGKIVKREEAMFPGYVFIALDKTHSNWTVIRSTRGVLRLVAFGSEPMPVDDSIVEKLKNTESGVPSLFKKGDNINIVDGPFFQLGAIYDEMDGEKRAIVFLNLMNKWHRVKLPLEQLSV